MIKKLVSPLSRMLISAKPITLNSNCSHLYFSTFMALFQTNKTKQQLSPVFIRPKHLPGHLKSKARKGVVSPKLNKRVGNPHPKPKTHKGMAKRIKIVGPSWHRQFKFKSPDNYHLKRNKSSNNLRRKSRARYIAKVDVARVKKLLPYHKLRSFKRLH